MLGRNKGAKVLVRRRRYLADGNPVENATSYLPSNVASGTPIEEEDAGPGGMPGSKTSGTRWRDSPRRCQPGCRTPRRRRHSTYPLGWPILRVVRRALGDDGTVLQVCDTIKAVDRYVLSYELPAD
ncbi:MAG: UTRA domain-containing protein [Actinomycetota bacterium]|nr:UTRA domain-containing protein [Actinomycetota bacterium]